MVIATKSALNQCNFSCKYCFLTDKERKDKIDVSKFDFDAIKKKMRELNEKSGDHNETVVLHGGEITAYPRDVIEDLLETAYNQVGHTSIQTNGWKIDEYWDLWEEYDTSLGISFDGPGECNLLRGFGDRDKRLEIADKIENNIFEAVDKGLDVSIIGIIHRYNGIKHRDKLKNFLKKLGEKGCNNGRLNPCSVTDNIAESPEWELTMDELIEVYDHLLDFSMEHGLKYSPMKDIGKKLMGKEAVCVFNSPCDIYGTPSLKGIYKDGREVCCVKVYRSEELYERQKPNEDIRKQVLRENDCKNCEWFNYCYGGCPNDGIDDDWRRKSEFCELYKHLFKRINNYLKGLGLKPRKVDRKCQNKEEGENGPPRDLDEIPDKFKHQDGEAMHIDSDVKDNKDDHSDGVKHNDGDLLHLDG